MKFSLFAGLGSFVMAALLCNSAFAQDDDYTSPYILKGPHFSLDEPWKVSQFNEALVGKTCAFEELTDASQLDTTQGKTIKTEVGKIYYLEVDKDNEYEQRAFIGLRRVVNDKQIVSFYTVQPKDNVGVMLFKWHFRNN